MPVAQNIGGVGDPTGPDSWFKSLPVITKYWFGASLVVTLAVNFQVIPGGQIVFFWDAIQSKFEVWRLLTCFLYVGKFEFNTLIALMLLVQFSERYEKGGPFNTGAGGGTADYAFMMMLLMTFTLLSYPLMMFVAPIPPIFARNMIYGVLYTWSKRNPTSQASIWGIPVPSIYLPFAYIAMTVFMGGAYMDMLHGMAVAHLYYFLVDVVPQVQGKDFLVTPQFLIDQFGVGQYQAPAPAAAAPAAGRPNMGGLGGQTAAAPAAASSGGHSWGSGGQRLGRD
uniref:Derlin n=1 Tax=Entomoneis paludosa TaxID=265537 RepID=A0A7S2YDG2_9STRA|mmetsp:Transcript_28469/g.59441  ORF Transcript_28469/g.59441 Transcript_28469/m.59441 type:complete len:281 (+) Transcript_28469:283-1125(+)|eukprot:CAMPEP_0172464772 /NCGR_PEP_ID=MMETSP1065-20121228/51534_1 /TAXON_ID=265537 /ORGANISM="Amphiprora paludosa, Strain CCMP125" /LENGTH=280 /DNA_ID=CAMNT_0013221111 /DNA_START=178 /DNA_END=1020 /DNA_ORIENTATION=+